MSDDFYLANELKVYLENNNGHIWQIPVNTAPTFSQGSESITLTASNIPAIGGILNRFTKQKKTSLAPAEWSFTTHVRPYTLDGVEHAVEDVLWELFAQGTSSNTLVDSLTSALDGEPTTREISFTNKELAENVTLYFIFKNSTGYRINGCKVNTASITTSLDSLAVISWQGFGTELSVFDPYEERFLIGSASFVGSQSWEAGAAIHKDTAAVSWKWSDTVDPVAPGNAEGGTGVYNGEVHIYNTVDQGATWSLTQKIFPDPSFTFQYLGSAIALEDDWLFMGAGGRDEIYLSRKNVAGGWGTPSIITSGQPALPQDFSGTTPVSGFGDHIKISGKYAVMGHKRWNKDASVTYTGGIELWKKKENNTGWNFQHFIESDQRGIYTFGSQIALDGTTMIAHDINTLNLYRIIEPPEAEEVLSWEATKGFTADGETSHITADSSGTAISKLPANEGLSGSWDSDLYTSKRIIGACQLSYRILQTDKYIYVSLSQYPGTYTGEAWNYLDYASYTKGGSQSGRYSVYRLSSPTQTTHPTQVSLSDNSYDTNDLLTIAYDGVDSISWYKNGVSVYTETGIGANKQFVAKVAIYNTATTPQIDRVRFTSRVEAPAGEGVEVPLSMTSSQYNQHMIYDSVVRGFLKPTQTTAVSSFEKSDLFSRNSVRGSCRLTYTLTGTYLNKYFMIGLAGIDPEHEITANLPYHAMDYGLYYAGNTLYTRTVDAGVSDSQNNNIESFPNFTTSGQVYSIVYISDGSNSRIEYYRNGIRFSIYETGVDADLTLWPIIASSSTTPSISPISDLKFEALPEAYAALAEVDRKTFSSTYPRADNNSDTLALNGTTAFFGRPAEAVPDAPTVSEGQVLVFDVSSDTITETQVIRPETPLVSYQHFGKNVSFDGTALYVAAPASYISSTVAPGSDMIEDYSEPGYVAQYVYNGASWVFRYKITDAALRNSRAFNTGMGETSLSAWGTNVLVPYEVDVDASAEDLQKKEYTREITSINGSFIVLNSLYPPRVGDSAVIKGQRYYAFLSTVGGVTGLKFNTNPRNGHSSTVVDLSDSLAQGDMLTFRMESTGSFSFLKFPPQPEMTKNKAGVASTDNYIINKLSTMSFGWKREEEFYLKGDRRSSTDGTTISQNEYYWASNVQMEYPYALVSGGYSSQDTLIGQPEGNVGSVYAYKYDENLNTWVFTQQIVLPIQERYTKAYFGGSTNVSGVALSKDGKFAVISAEYAPWKLGEYWYDTPDKTGVQGRLPTNDVNSLYNIDADFNDAWHWDSLSTSASDGEYSNLSATFVSSATSANLVTGSGLVITLTILSGRITAVNITSGGQNYRHGDRVSFTYDGVTSYLRLIIRTGMAYVFQREGDEWVYMDRLGPEHPYITSSDHQNSSGTSLNRPEYSAFFGYSGAISPDCSLIAIGAPHVTYPTQAQNSGKSRLGALFLFKRKTSSGWEFSDYIEPGLGEEEDQDRYGLYDSVSCTNSEVSIGSYNRSPHGRVKNYLVDANGSATFSQNILPPTIPWGKYPQYSQFQYFGASVEYLTDDMMVISDFGAEVSPTDGRSWDQGAVLFYKKIAGTWTPISMLEDYEQVGWLKRFGYIKISTDVSEDGKQMQIASSSWSQWAFPESIEETYVNSSGGITNTQLLLSNVLDSSSPITGTVLDGYYDVSPGYSSVTSGTGAVFRYTFESNNITDLQIIKSGTGYKDGDLLTVWFSYDPTGSAANFGTPLPLLNGVDPTGLSGDKSFRVPLAIRNQGAVYIGKSTDGGNSWKKVQSIQTPKVAYDAEQTGINTAASWGHGAAISNSHLIVGMPYGDLPGPETNRGVFFAYKSLQDFPISEMSISISNNLSPISYPLLGEVDKPLGFTSGGLSVSGSISGYIFGGEGYLTTQSLLNKLLDSQVEDLPLSINVGGSSTYSNRLFLSLADVHIPNPEVLVGDISSFNFNFTGNSLDTYKDVNSDIIKLRYKSSSIV